MFCSVYPYKVIVALFVILLALLCTNNNALASAQERPDDAMRASLQKAIAKADSFEDRFEAEVWLLDMATRIQKYVPSEKERIAIIKNVHREASNAGISPQLVLAVMEVESAFERFAISRVGARGLMQIMPFWTKEIGRPDDNLFDIRTNIRYGCYILKHYLDREKGNTTRALGRYNGSLGKFKYPMKVYKALDRHWKYH